LRGSFADDAGAAGEADTGARHRGRRRVKPMTVASHRLA
jgi:hypothetical protein